MFDRNNFKRLIIILTDGILGEKQPHTKISHCAEHLRRESCSAAHGPFPRSIPNVSNVVSWLKLFAILAQPHFKLKRLGRKLPNIITKRCDIFMFFTRWGSTIDCGRHEIDQIQASP